MYGTRAPTIKSTLVQLNEPTWTVRPRYWVPREEVENRVNRLWSFNWLVAFRNAISAVADARSVGFSIIPRFGVGNSLPLLLSQCRAKDICLLLGNLNSFILDYVAKQKAGGGNLNFFIVKQFPVLPLAHYSEDMKNLIVPNIVELTYTSWELESFAHDCDYDLPPFLWDEERRLLLRCELDAAYFHLYGIVRDDVDYIMETFSIVKRKDDQQYGEYRTKRIILEFYDEMAQAIATSQPFKTRLNPPPADHSVTHPPQVQAEPFILPTGIRYPQPDEGIYAMRVILSLLQANDGTIDVQRLMNACSLLAMPDKLERHAVVAVGSLAHEWRQRFSDTFNPNLFLPKLDDLAQRGEIKLLRQGNSFVVTRIGSSALIPDADIELDTRLALRAADSLSLAEKDAISPIATSQEIEARSRVA